MVSQVRRWAVDWLASRDPSVCPDLLAPSYSLLIGGYRLGPRDEYVEATLHQLDRFPGLGVTVHDLLASGDRVAVRFTEHGAARKLDGRTAAWRGVALFRWDGERLTECFAEEDYFGRRRQLDTGACDVIDPPAAAPWNAEPGPAAPAAEQVVRDWLDDGRLLGVDLDDRGAGPATDVRLEDASVEVSELFSAGDRVAFHAVRRGRYAGGFEDLPGGSTDGAALHLAGIVAVAGGAVAGGYVVRDRLGLHRALTDAARSRA